MFRLKTEKEGGNGNLQMVDVDKDKREQKPRHPKLISSMDGHRFSLEGGKIRKGLKGREGSRMPFILGLMSDTRIGLPGSLFVNGL